MDSAIAGLLGALIGALAGLGGSFITHKLQSKLEQKKWLREKREEAYANSIKYLFRVLNKRSEIHADGKTSLGKEFAKEWFDDLIEAQVWVTSLTIYCADSQREAISKVAERLSTIVSGFKIEGFDAFITDAYKTIVNSAREDLGKDIQA